MSIFTKIRSGETFHEEVPATLGQALGVAAEEAVLFSPSSSLHRLQQLRAAERGDPVSLGGGEFGTGEAPVMRETSRLLGADEARERVKEAGVQLDIPDEGIREAALGLLVERKRDEMRRQDILSRAPAGAGATAARFGVALAASVFDPLNVAASFVPLVGPTRYAAMLSRARTAAQRAGVRAQVGAAEGAAGAALIEPIVLGAAITEQADYDAADSLLNIALGTGLGAGLHTGGGAIADAVAKGRPWQTARGEGELPRLLEDMRPETREAALRTAVSQAVTGRQIDVEPVLRMDGAGAARFGEPEMRAGLAEPRRPSPDLPPEPTFQEMFGTGDATRQRRLFRAIAPTLPPRQPQPTSLIQFLARHGGLREEAGELAHMGLGRHFVPGAGPLVRQSGMSLDRAREMAAEAGFLGPSDRAVAETTPDDLLRAIDEDFRAGGVISEQDADLAEAARLRRDIETERDLLHDVIRDVEAAAGARESEDFLIAVARDVMETGDEVLDALERAALREYYAHGDPAPVRRETGDDLEEVPFDADPDRPRTGAERPAVQEPGGERGAGAVRQSAEDGGAVRAAPATPPRPAAGDAFGELTAQARASFQPENSRLADFEASRLADEDLRTAPGDEDMPDVTLDEAMQDVTDLARALGDEELPARELAAFDDLDGTARAYGQAVRAAANCGLRRGGS